MEAVRKYCIGNENASRVWQCIRSLQVYSVLHVDRGRAAVFLQVLKKNLHTRVYFLLLYSVLVYFSETHWFKTGHY